MTRHLTPQELIDALENTLGPARASHVGDCEVCREDLAQVRALVSEAGAASPVPEPSPLFWEHFSARVHEAIAADTAPRVSWMERWLSWKIAVPAAACVVTLLAVAATMRVAQAPETSAEQTVSRRTSDELVPPTDDPSWILMTDLAGDLDWDAAVEAGLTGPAGGVDRALFDLNAAERSALGRLLRAELAGPGA